MKMIAGMLVVAMAAVAAAQDVHEKAGLNLNPLPAPNNQDVIPPGTPTLTLIQVGPTAVEVSWTAPGDNNWVANTKATSYQLSYDTVPPTAPVVVSPAPVPSVEGTIELITVDVGTPGVYSFVLKSIDDVGNYSTTTPAEITLDSTAPGKVVGLASTGVASDSVTLAWTPASGDAATYTVHILANGAYAAGSEALIVTDPASQHITVAATLATTTTVSGLSDSTSYQVTVTAADMYGNTNAPSDSITVQTAEYVQGEASAKSTQGMCGGSASGATGLALMMVFVMIGAARK